MSNYYLDFEKPIKVLDDQIISLSSLTDPSKNDLQSLTNLKEERAALIQNIYSGLTRWQRIQLARHPDRPYSLDYINYFSHNFIELHGDRHYMDDHAVVAGIGHMDEYKIAWIGQQKGRNTKENLFRNFGMMRPEGYRKAMRIMKLAEKFRLPVITFMDTIGAYPGIGAEERGQGEAIARNLMEMSSLKVPIISVVIGEGASGGALGIGVGDKIFMLENTWYSVISPESCSSILWRSWEHKEEAAEALKLTSKEMLQNKLIDKIIKEPLGGAHYDRETTFLNVKKEILSAFKQVSKIESRTRVEQRRNKFIGMGEIL